MTDEWLVGEQKNIRDIEGYSARVIGGEKHPQVRIRQSRPDSGVCLSHFLARLFQGAAFLLGSERSDGELWGVLVA